MLRTFSVYFITKSYILASVNFFQLNNFGVKMSRVSMGLAQGEKEKDKKMIRKHRKNRILPKLWVC